MIDIQIAYVCETNFLGVWLDNNLNWDFNVEKLVIKLSKLCFAIKAIKSFVNKNIVKPMYFAYTYYVGSAVLYCRETLEILTQFLNYKKGQ